MHPLPALEIRSVAPEAVPLALLLDADPSERKVRGYLPRCACFAAFVADELVGACLVLPLGEGVAEIINLAVSPAHQGRGIGRRLLEHAIADATARGLRRLELGTGTFGHQLTLYQRVGFRAERVDRDFFVDHYDEPLFENGVRHRDMLRFGLALPRRD